MMALPTPGVSPERKEDGRDVESRSCGANRAREISPGLARAVRFRDLRFRV